MILPDEMLALYIKGVLDKLGSITDCEVKTDENSGDCFLELTFEGNRWLLFLHEKI